MKSEYDMKNTTLCYLERDGKFLMLYRNKKQNDINQGKWVGIGGKFENGESPYECVRREVFEETGVKPLNVKYRGIVTFVTDKIGTEYLHVFTANGFDGEVNFNCNEGTLKWIDKSEILSLNLWQGDKYFLEYVLNDSQNFFSIKMCYRGDDLVSVKIDE